MERTKVVPVQAGEIFDKKLFLMYYKCSSHASVEDSLNLCPLLAGGGSSHSSTGDSTIFSFNFYTPCSSHASVGTAFLIIN